MEINVDKNLITKTEDAKPLLEALRNGLVPREGIQYLQVGRTAEADTINKQIEFISNGHNVFKVICGEYGSGKTHLMSYAKYAALNKGLCTMWADFGPNQLLSGSGSKGKNFYLSLVTSFQSSSRSLDSGLMEMLADIFSAHKDKVEGLVTKSKYLYLLTSKDFAPIKNMKSGDAVIQVLAKFFEASLKDDLIGINSVKNFFFGAFGTKTDVAKSLGIKVDPISDKNWIDMIPILSQLCLLAGRKGLVVFMDEAINLMTLPSKKSRDTNYEMLVTLVNDVTKERNSFTNTAFYLSALPELINDPKKGFKSNQSLSHRFPVESHNISGPIIRLKSMNKSEISALLIVITNFYEVVKPGLFDTPVRIDVHHLIQQFESGFSEATGCKDKSTRTLILKFTELMDRLMGTSDREEIIKTIDLKANAFFGS